MDPMHRLAAATGEHFQMEDGSYLVVPRKASEAEQLEGTAADGDVAFTLRRKRERLVGLLHPAAGEELDQEVVSKAASIVALYLQRRRVVFDDKQERSYDISYRVLPSSLRLSLSTGPASKNYAQMRCLKPAARRGAAKALVGEISKHIHEGKLEEALERTGQVHSLPGRYRELVAKGLLDGFARLGQEIREDDSFYIPRLLSAHRAFGAVLGELRPYLPPDALPRPQGRAALASIRGDYGQGKDIVADILSVTGHRVSDLGTNMAPEDIVKEIRADGPEMLVITGQVPITLRLATDLMARRNVCRAAVEELLELLKQAGLRDQLEIVLVGFAFSKDFARRLRVTAVCRTLRSLFGQFHRRSV
jgi:methanogenic corrinoid protein MtbC1